MNEQELKNLTPQKNIRYKFRGKKQDGTWIYGDLSQLSYNNKNCAHIFPQCEIDEILSPDNYEVDFKTVSQYTGLKDANGKEIYIDNIVEFYQSQINKEGSAYELSQIKTTAVVILDKYFNTSLRKRDGTILHIDQVLGEHEGIVIGNIRRL